MSRFDDEMQIAACQGKTGYLTWDGAKQSMSRNKFKPNSLGGRVAIYRCRYCSQWHIGSTQQKGR